MIEQKKKSLAELSQEVLTLGEAVVKDAKQKGWRARRLTEKHE